MGSQGERGKFGRKVVLKMLDDDTEEISTQGAHTPVSKAKKPWIAESRLRDVHERRAPTF